MIPNLYILDVIDNDLCTHQILFIFSSKQLTYSRLKIDFLAKSETFILALMTADKLMIWAKQPGAHN